MAEELHYEHGLMIFTEDYLRRQGFCCGCGCRHCPYITPAEETARRYDEELRSQRATPGRSPLDPPHP